MEYDKRFERYGSDFVFYDYNCPLDLPGNLERSFDIVVVDPPYLSEECLSKTAKTVKYLAKDKVLLCTGGVHHLWSQGETLLAPPTHIANCPLPQLEYVHYPPHTHTHTGAVMEDLAYKFLGVKKCIFRPTHARNLGNEFRCYTNYETGLNRPDGEVATT